MDIYFDTRNEREAQERYPMPFRWDERPSGPPSFNIYTVHSYNHHGFDWKAVMHSVIRAPSPGQSELNSFFTTNCYFKAMRLAWLRAWQQNNPGSGAGMLYDSSVATFQRLGRVVDQANIWLHKIPLEQRVRVQGFAIGTGTFVVEKIVQL